MNRSVIQVRTPTPTWPYWSVRSSVLTRLVRGLTCSAPVPSMKNGEIRHSGNGVCTRRAPASQPSEKSPLMCSPTSSAESVADMR